MSVSLNIHGAKPNMSLHAEPAYILRHNDDGTAETVVVLVTDESGVDFTFFFSDMAQAARVASAFQ